MAFYLHTAEVDKARTIAERGLTTISFRYVFYISINITYLSILPKRGTREIKFVGGSYESGKSLWYTRESHESLPKSNPTK